jgi:hypothetical protein
VKKVLFGIAIGFVLSTLIFFINGFFSVKTEIPQNHVTVKILIETEKPISKLTLTSSNSTQTIELKGQTETVIIFPNPGEGTFKICCLFLDGKEVCSKGDYVEGGYSPILKIRNSQIETIEWH